MNSTTQFVNQNIVLKREWHPTKNLPLTPDTVTLGSGKKVWWLCKNGHEWQAAPCKRKRGDGCPYCSGRSILAGYNDLATKNPTLAKEWHPTKNGDLMPSQVAAGSGKKVWWLCKNGHEWQASILSRSQGNGCPYCSGHRILAGYNDLATKNPTLAKEWHPTKNGDLMPSQVASSSRQKVWWLCKNGHEWQALIVNRNAGNQCPYCSHRKLSPKSSNVAPKRPLPAEEWHPTKNGDLMPSQVTSGSGKKVWWLCKNGHEWQTSPRKRVRGDGCPYCSGRSILTGYNDLATKNPDLTKEWHPTKNLPLTPEKISAKSAKAVWWLCKNGHEWQAKVSNRANGNGCPYCSGRKVIPGATDFASIHPELVSEWHPTKNGDMKPNEVSPNCRKKIWWLCKEGHEWQATVNHRNNGTGCPICHSGNKTSFSEQAVYYYIHKYCSDAKNRFDKNGFELDIYIPSRRIGIEYDGVFYHKDRLVNDNKKDLLCKEKNIELYRIREEGLPQTETAICIERRLSSNVQKSNIELNQTVIALLSFLNINDADVDVERDTQWICSQYEISKKGKSIQLLKPELLAEWNYKKNIPLTPDKVSIGSGKKVWWLCKNGHEWQAAVYKRCEGRGCPYCSGNAVLAGYNDLATKNPTLAKEWHPTKNGDLMPSQVTSGSGKKVWWLCKNGHEWQAVISSRNQGCGCPYCKK